MTHEERRKRNKELVEAKRQRELDDPNREANLRQEEFVKRREKLAARTGQTSKQAGQILGSERADIAQREFDAREEIAAADVRRKGFQEVTGSEELRQELIQKRDAPPDISPTPISEIGLRPATDIAASLSTGIEELTGKKFDTLSAEELGKTKLGKAIGFATIAAGAAAFAPFIAPFVAQVAAKSTILKAVTGTGGSVPALRTAIEGLGIFLGVGAIFDFEGKEMDTFRKKIQGVIEDGERIEASARNSADTTDTIFLLQTISEEVNFAEQRIKELGFFNIEYRSSKEFVDDMDNIRSARIALLRRLDAVENIAATGAGALRPEELLFNASQFK